MHGAGNALPEMLWPEHAPLAAIQQSRAELRGLLLVGDASEPTQDRMLRAAPPRPLSQFGYLPAP